MSEPVRMRRDLVLPVPAPAWPDGWSVRTLLPGDERPVHALLAAGYAGGGGRVAGFDRWWTGLRDDDEFDASLCFLAIDPARTIAGVAQCWTSGFVKDLVVDETARGRGVGAALLLTALSAFRARGTAYVDLKVEPGNERATRLYERLGLREVA